MSKYKCCTNTVQRTPFAQPPPVSRACKLHTVSSITTCKNIVVLILELSQNQSFRSPETLFKFKPSRNSIFKAIFFVHVARCTCIHVCCVQLIIRGLDSVISSRHRQLSYQKINYNFITIQSSAILVLK